MTLEEFTRRMQEVAAVVDGGTGHIELHAEDCTPAELVGEGFRIFTLRTVCECHGMIGGVMIGTVEELDERITGILERAKAHVTNKRKGMH